MATPKALDLPHRQVPEFLEEEEEEGRWESEVSLRGESLLTSYESLMRSVMFACLAAGMSVSAGGEGVARDDSSLPIWSRKLRTEGIQGSARAEPPPHGGDRRARPPGEDHQRLSVVDAGG